ncbi:uncharacterized protein LOC142320107 [Lycorma delicatula]|uniref:uncharacterized protein LOC142320107 n=1 Tax=Lycorma delicatula TaxID=130591 RepID=UPI003F516E0F
MKLLLLISQLILIDAVKSQDFSVTREIDPNKITLNVPSSWNDPILRLVEAVSLTVGNVIQNTAERFGIFLEQMKIIFYHKFFSCEHRSIFKWRLYKFREC